MRFIEHDESVHPEQARVVGPYLGRHAVAGQEQPRADHVDSTDDDGWRTWILEPLLVVDMLTTQRRDRQRPFVEAESLRDPRFALDPLAQFLRDLGGLIDNHAAIYDVDEPARERRAARSGV